MSSRFLRLGAPALSMLAACVLVACGGSGNDDPAPAAQVTSLSGVVATGAPLAKARITVFDSTGAKRSTEAGTDGAYSLDVEGMVAPLMIQAVEAGNSNCSDGAKLWARCMGALLGRLTAGAKNVANVNPLTDKLVSDVAATLKAGDATLVGPQALLDKGTAKGITAELISSKVDEFRPAILQALKDAGVANADSFDPVTTPMKADHTGVDALLDVIVFNRGYDNNSGKPGGTMLLDADYNYIGKMDALSKLEPLDLKRAQAAKAKMEDASYTRVLIVGDSTASTYELARMPRMGWGQVFEDQFKAGAKVKVLNGAKSGRSSRNFYNQGYYDQMAAFLRAGDYVIIHHGHNDQNCDSTKASRGAADVYTMCTYPNDANGGLQHPPGQPELSFQKSLERYVTAARAKGAIPILMTPTTRVWNASRKTGFPVVPQHITTQNSTNGFAFVGDYVQTIKNTATATSTPLIDIEAKTIAFANAHQADWKDYWLAADPAVYTWYASQTSGTLAAPDTTHFQEKGAREVAAMVSQGLKDSTDANLAKLVGMLK